MAMHRGSTDGGMGGGCGGRLTAVVSDSVARATSLSLSLSPCLLSLSLSLSALLLSCSLALSLSLNVAASPPQVSGPDRKHAPSPRWVHTPVHAQIEIVYPRHKARHTQQTRSCAWLPLASRHSHRNAPTRCSAERRPSSSPFDYGTAVMMRHAARPPRTADAAALDAS